MLTQVTSRLALPPTMYDDRTLGQKAVVADHVMYTLGGHDSFSKGCTHRVTMCDPHVVIVEVDAPSGGYCSMMIIFPVMAIKSQFLPLRIFVRPRHYS